MENIFAAAFPLICKEICFELCFDCSFDSNLGICPVLCLSKELCGSPMKGYGTNNTLHTIPGIKPVCLLVNGSLNSLLKCQNVLSS